jgi:hypothetical protein
MARPSREASRASRLTTTPVNLGVANEVAKEAAQAAAKKTISLRKAIAVAAMISAAAAVGIFAGNEMGAFDATPESTESGPPSSAAPQYGAGDTLDRPDAVAEAKARAQALLSRFRAGPGGSQNDLLLNALIDAARNAPTRDASEVFLTLALELNPSDAMAARLRAALKSAVYLRPGARVAGIGDDYLLGDDPPREVVLDFQGPDSEFRGGAKDAAAEGATTAPTEEVGVLRTFEAATSGGSTAETDTGSEGSTGDIGAAPSTLDGTTIAGPAPIPLPTPTPASTTR